MLMQGVTTIFAVDLKKDTQINVKENVCYTCNLQKKLVSGKKEATQNYKKTLAKLITLLIGD